MTNWNVDLKNPFSQALIRVGQQRGYPAMAIAASIGNAAQESGLRMDALGDNGSAHGGFQWRKDRFQNLQNTAGAMGKAWTDPEVQANHWYNEMDGKYGGEKPYGDALKAARNDREANEAVIRSLRPAGSQDGVRNAHNYSGRLNATQEAFRLLSGSDGGVNPGVLSKGNPADLPAEGAQDASFQMPQQAPPKEGWDAFMSGGPGALFGQPQAGWNLGDALTGAGAALMARDNPDGAKSLLAGMRALQKVNEDPGINTQIDSRTGRAYTYDSKGNVSVKQIHAPDAKPISDTAVKLIQGNNDASEAAWNAAEGTRKYTRLLMDGKVNLSALSRIGNDFATFTNDSDEGTRNAAGLMSHLMRMRDAKLFEAKGVQTEGDATRALEALLPGNAKFDNKAVASLFRDLSKEFTGTYDEKQRYNQALFTRYKDYDPEGFYKSRYDDRMKQARDADALIEKGWGNFANPPAAPVVTSGTAPTGRDPVKSAGKPKGSFLEFFDRRAAQ
ncbi:phage tail tip lysozyme [Methylobacterium sp. UNC378MF]|uniref:phage tail tip lysozyme n=1 Tax=Methylobacterium sp. UNC378MF TaxID=1502748 RepID=UPI0011142B4E|nr:phage tail tip lysozyme [Methylobacterium sp. UNC378MF]